MGPPAAIVYALDPSGVATTRPSPAVRAYSSSSTLIAVITCPVPSRIAAKSLIANRGPADPAAISSAGRDRVVQFPAVTYSSAAERPLPGTDVSPPILPHATPSTGREAGAAACRAVRAVPSPPTASTRSHEETSMGSATRRACPGIGTWPSATPCFSAQARVVARAVSRSRLGWTTSATRVGASGERSATEGPSGRAAVHAGWFLRHRAGEYCHGVAS